MMTATVVRRLSIFHLFNAGTDVGWVSTSQAVFLTWVIWAAGDPQWNKNSKHGKSRMVLSQILMPFIIFGGLLINIEEIPPYFVWLSVFSFVQYGKSRLAISISKPFEHLSIHLVKHWMTLLVVLTRCLSPLVRRELFYWLIFYIGIVRLVVIEWSICYPQQWCDLLSLHFSACEHVMQRLEDDE